MSDQDAFEQMNDSKSSRAEPRVRIAQRRAGLLLLAGSFFRAKTQ